MTAACLAIRAAGATEPVGRAANRHVGGYTGQIVEVPTLVCYRFSAAALEVDGVTIERRQAPD